MSCSADDLRGEFSAGASVRPGLALVLPLAYAPCATLSRFGVEVLLFFEDDEGMNWIREGNVFSTLLMCRSITSPLSSCKLCRRLSDFAGATGGGGLDFTKLSTTLSAWICESRRSPGTIKGSGLEAPSPWPILLLSVSVRSIGGTNNLSLILLLRVGKSDAFEILSIGLLGPDGMGLELERSNANVTDVTLGVRRTSIVLT